MFGLGMPEILLILAIALIVIGPKKLPELAKTLGRAMGEFKRSAQDLKRSIDMEATVQDVKSSTTNIKDVLRKSRRKTDSGKTDAGPEAPDNKNADHKNANPEDAGTPREPETSTDSGETIDNDPSGESAGKRDIKSE